MERTACGARRDDHGLTFGAMALLGVASVLSACADASGDVTQVSDAITGGDTTVVTYSEGMPERAVGYLLFPAFACSATAIQRDVILTVGHCFSDSGVTQDQVLNGAVTFHLPYQRADGTQTDLNGGAGIASVHGATIATPGVLMPGGGTFVDRFDTWSDLGLIFLERELTTEELPSLPRVLTRRPTIWPSLPQITGWGPSLGALPSVKRAATLESFSLEVPCILETGLLGVTFSVSCGPGHFESPGPARADPGDSGGPLTFDAQDGRSEIAAVVYGGLGTTTYYSPTFNVGGQPIDNGDFLLQWLEDADGDGVNRGSDNCEPERCNFDPSLECFNPEQEDTDDDGVGDSCDNCPGSLCLKLWLDPTVCYNPSQSDSTDHDGVGDVCDACPLTHSRASRDSDLDGVPDACDTCPGSPGAYQACTSDAECTDRNQGGVCLGSSDLELRRFGRCGSGGPMEGSICGSFCNAGGTCESLGTFGRCLAQPNNDGDSRGDSCDLCPDLPNEEVNANSNGFTELFAGVEPQGDLCDPTPLFVSRPVLQPPDSPVASDVTVFTASAGIGVGAVSPLSTTVGFRWCRCGEGGLRRETCIIRNECPIDAELFDAEDNPPAGWRRITTGTFGPGAVTGAELPPALYNAAPRARVFDSTVACNDLAPHPFLADEDEPCRLGPQETLFWFTAEDIAAGHVAEYAPGRTSGLFWSHALAENGQFGDGPAGARDAATGGALRSNYNYADTPLIRPTVDIVLDAPRLCLACEPLLRRDLLLDPDLLGDLRGSLATPGRVALDPAGLRVGVVGAAGQAAQDITTAISETVRTLIADPSNRFLTPVESGDRGARAVPGLQWLTVPEAIDLADPSGIVPVFARQGRLVVEAELEEPDPEDPEIPAPEFRLTPKPRPGGARPDPATGFGSPLRVGVRGLLSVADHAVYLIGGRYRDEAGARSGEIWRFDLGPALSLHSSLPRRVVLPTSRARTGMWSPRLEFGRSSPRRYSPWRTTA